MAMNARRIAGVVAIGAFVLSLLGTPPADAKKRKKQRSLPVSVFSSSKATSGDNQQVTVTATCPPGLIAVGGGFAAPILVASGGVTDFDLVYESRRSGQAAWQVTAVRSDTGGPGPDLSVFADVDCRARKLSSSKRASSSKKRRKRLLITEVSSSDTSATANLAQASATARCPSRTKAVGGGYSSSPPPTFADPFGFQFVWTSHRDSPTSWRAALTTAGVVARRV